MLAVNQGGRGKGKGGGVRGDNIGGDLQSFAPHTSQSSDPRPTHTVPQQRPKSNRRPPTDRPFCRFAVLLDGSLARWLAPSSFQPGGCRYQPSEKRDSLNRQGSEPHALAALLSCLCSTANVQYSALRTVVCVQRSIFTMAAYTPDSSSTLQCVLEPTCSRATLC